MFETTPTTLSKDVSGEWHINQIVINKIWDEYGEVIRPVKYKGKNKKVLVKKGQ